MAVETVAVSCASGQYTALSSGATDVSFRGPAGGSRLVLASSLPAAGEANFFPVNSGEVVNLGELTGNVYLMPLGAAATVYVVRK